MTIWRAARAGDRAEVQRLVGQDPGLLNAKDDLGWTPLMSASDKITWAWRDGCWTRGRPWTSEINGGRPPCGLRAVMAALLR
jgi:hypothetical protein